MRARLDPTPEEIRARRGPDLRLFPVAAGVWVSVGLTVAWRQPAVCLGCALVALWAFGWLAGVLPGGRGRDAPHGPSAHKPGLRALRVRPAVPLWARPQVRGTVRALGVSAGAGAISGALAAVRVTVVDSQPLVRGAVDGAGTHYRGTVRVTGVPRMLADGSVMVPVRLPDVGTTTLFLRPAAEQELQGGPGAAVVTAPVDLQPGSVLDVAARVRATERAGLVPVDLSATRPPELLSPPHGVAGWAADVREALRVAAAGLPWDTGPLVPSMALGDTAHLDPVTAARFTATGLSHLTAVSGANVAIVLASVSIMTTLLTARRLVRLAASAAALVLFVVLVGPEPSVLRAAVMGVVGLVAVWSARWSSALAAAATAVIVILTVDPAMAVSYGFALSMAATVGIVALAPALSRPLLRRWVRWCERRWDREATRAEAMLIRAVGVAVAAELATVPLVVHMTGLVSPVSVVVNLVVAPVVPVVTCAGLGGAVLAAVSTSVGLPAAGATVVMIPAALGAWWVREVASVASGWGVVSTPGGTVWAAVVALGGAAVVATVRGWLPWQRARWGWMGMMLVAALALRTGVVEWGARAGAAGEGWWQDVSAVDGWEVVACSPTGTKEVVVATGGDPECPAPVGRAGRAGEASGAVVWRSGSGVPPPPGVVVVESEQDVVSAAGGAPGAEAPSEIRAYVVTRCGRSKGRPSVTASGVPVVFPCADGTVVVAGGRQYASGVAP